mmetsp:Transcript_673/g.724  ORF Transcript_673/g.724 Transcript_673/m.724 type:complete len:82 (-) Transcript_673:76-321(-)
MNVSLFIFLQLFIKFESLLFHFDPLFLELGFFVFKFLFFIQELPHFLFFLLKGCIHLLPEVFKVLLSSQHLVILNIIFIFV